MERSYLHYSIQHIERMIQIAWNGIVSCRSLKIVKRKKEKFKFARYIFEFDIA